MLYILCSTLMCKAVPALLHVLVQWNRMCDAANKCIRRTVLAERNDNWPAARALMPTQDRYELSMTLSDPSCTWLTNCCTDADLSASDGDDSFIMIPPLPGVSTWKVNSMGTHTHYAQRKPSVRRERLPGSIYWLPSPRVRLLISYLSSKVRVTSAW